MSAVNDRGAMRALRALGDAGWRVARRALEVPTRFEWREEPAVWRVACARELAAGRWYLLDVWLEKPVEEIWQSSLKLPVRFDGARAKVFFHLEQGTRSLTLRPPAPGARLASLRVVRVPRRLALTRVQAALRRFLPQRAAARWQRIVSERGAGSDPGLFQAYRRALAGGPAAAPKRSTAAAPKPRATPEQRRALCIDQLLPRPDRDAGGYAAVQEIKLLQALGYEVSFLAEEEGGDATALEELEVDVLGAADGEILREIGAGLDLVYMTRHHVARDWIEAARRHAPQAKLVLNVADLHFVRQAREAALYGDAAALADAEAARRAELDAIARVDQVLCYSHTEIALLQACGVAADKLSRCPWVAELPERTPGYAAREGIAFLGGYGHPPNVDAAVHFALDILPLIRRKRRHVAFRVYGANVPPEVQALQGPDVEVHGYVPDVAAAYDGCRVFVAPLRFGAGLKGKVVTALARGTPSVLSPVAAEGLFYLSGAEAAIAETPQEWVERVLAFYDDEALWRQCSLAARDFARRNFGAGHGRRLMAQALVRAGVRLPER